MKLSFLLVMEMVLGPGDKGYKRMKKVFTNPIFKWLFKRLNSSRYSECEIGQYISVKNKMISGDEDATVFR